MSNSWHPIENAKVFQVWKGAGNWAITADEYFVRSFQERDAAVAYARILAQGRRVIVYD